MTLPTSPASPGLPTSPTSSTSSTSPAWPDGLVPYRRTPEFTEASTPQALQRAHSTRAGTWARLHVLDGHLIFRDLVTGACSTLAEGIHPLIFPQRDHQVELIGPVRFFVEFCEPTEGGDPVG